MPERDTAEQKLNRILYILPAAARRGGAMHAELAAALGVGARKIGRDVVEAYARGDYSDPGQALEANLAMTGEHVELPTPGGFRRPLRLEAREAAALGLGLRSLAADAAPERRARLLALAAELERVLVLPKAASTRERLVAVQGDRPAGDVYERLRTAALERRRCRIGYVKAGSAEVETRTVEPYVLLYAERWWYAVSHCRDRGAIRLFRVDRVLEVEPLDERFELPAGFDPAAHAPGGRAFVAAAPVDARVRYGARIAGWIRERYPDAETNGDGSVELTHAVADPRWLVRHVLQYGADAEVLAPPALRAVVRERVARFGGGGLG